MSTVTDETALHECACGCGTPVKGKYARGHWARLQAAARKLQPLPGPDDDLGEDEDLPPELVAELDDMDRLAWLSDPETGGPPAESEDERDDPPAARIPPARSSGAAGSEPKRTRVTAAIQRDVHAKIRMILRPAGRVWQIRDPLCGGTFAEQEPEISESLAEIVCDSPDLLNWFTGPAGGYMKYFRLFMAVQPVLLMVWMHHVAHAERQAPLDGQQPPQQPAYAA